MRLWLSILLFVAFSGEVVAAVIDPANRIDWVVGSTVGLRQGIATRTTLLDVTQAPYNCPTDGTSDCQSAIQAAIDAASSNEVVYIPSGYYRLASDITINKHGITLRGEGTNTVLYRTNSGTRLLSVGHDYNFGAPAILVASNVIKGATNLIVFSTNDLRVGDCLNISTKNPQDVTTDVLQLFSAPGYNRTLSQPVRIDSIVGTNVHFWPPSVWHFTNAPAYSQLSLAYVNSPMRERIGLENIRFSLTNEQMSGSPVGNLSYIVQLWSLNENWITGCTFDWSRNYHVSQTVCVMGYFGSNTIERCQTSGTSLAGYLTSLTSGHLMEDNILRIGLQPAIELNNGYVGNAIFGNFMTNNTLDIITHNVHPMMNLVEANIMDNFMLDGYFGSVSHFTLWRNWIYSTYQPLRFKRWATYNQVVGNVLGTGGSTYDGGYDGEFPVGNQAVVIQMGLPNLGNQSFVYTNPPTHPFWPGLILEGVGGAFHTNGVFTLTRDIGPTNTIWIDDGDGTLTNFPSFIGGVFAVKFSAASNTNLYYGATNDSALGWVGSGTSSNLVLNAYIYATNGSRLWIAGQQPYQTLMRTNRETENITGNVAMTNSTGVVVWSAGNPAQALAASILYPSSAPSYWGTNRWPSIDTNSPFVTSIPSQLRSLGISSGSGGGGATGTNGGVIINSGVSISSGVSIQ